jgi:addiction module RelE/StbE family toxin
MPKAKYQINLTEAAEQDLTEIADYIAGENPSAALKVIVRIEKNILKLEHFPLIGVVPRIRRLARKGYRILIVDDYLVFYVITDNEIIEIRRILSGKRDYQFLF